MKFLIIIMVLLSSQLKADVIFKNGFELTCSESMYPANLRIIKDTYQNVNDGFPFTASTNTSFLLDMGLYSFHSLAGFSFPYADARRRIVFIDAPTNHHLMAQGTLSISLCPGDFSSTATCVMPVNNTTTLKFSTKAADSPDDYCKLDPTKVYFANYVHSPDPENVAPSCSDAQHQTCAMFYTEAALN